MFRTFNKNSGIVPLEFNLLCTGKRQESLNSPSVLGVAVVDAFLFQPKLVIAFSTLLIIKTDYNETSVDANFIENMLFNRDSV